MSEAPERIWAEPYWGDDPNDRFWTDHEWTVMLTKEEASDHCPEWIRHDLHLAALAEKDAEIAKLLDQDAAFERVWAVVREWDISTEPGPHRLYEGINGDHVRAIIRAALDTGKG